MKKQRLISVLTAAAVCLSLTACGDSEETSNSGASYDIAAPADDACAAPEIETARAINEEYNTQNYPQTESIITEQTAAGDGQVGLYEDEECAPAYDGVLTSDNGYYPPDYPSYIVNSEEYAEITESGFLSVADSPLSTFSADVDTASYTNIRRFINNGSLPDPNAVRIEEILNYFDYNYAPPVNNEPFSVTAELSDCPWNDRSKLMLVGIKAEEAEITDISNNLVFLIDVSGSMFSGDKLPLVQQAFSMLADNLDENDKISIVTYAGEDEIVLEGESGDNRKKITDAIDGLSAGGSTAGAAGIKTAYELAEKYFIKDGSNRVILATDGDLNVGASSVEDLTALIEEKRESGVYLSVLGFGEGNYKDDRLEALADNGNGNYSYIDSVAEAKKVLIEEMDSTLVTVAKDVKFQVEFNPANVAGYRLIGYENRALDDRDFNDDTKDAGEVGAGSAVTVLYEIITVSDAEKYAPEYKYSGNVKKTEENEEKADKYSDELLTVNIRCKTGNEDESRLYIYPVKTSLYSPGMSKNLNFAACCAEFGMLLRGSENKGTSSWDSLLEMLDVYDYSDDEYKTEFEYLVRAAARFH